MFYCRLIENSSQGNYYRSLLTKGCVRIRLQLNYISQFFVNPILVKYSYLFTSYKLLAVIAVWGKPNLMLPVSRMLEICNAADRVQSWFPQLLFTKTDTNMKTLILGDKISQARSSSNTPRLTIFMYSLKWVCCNIVIPRALVWGIK